ncbi:acyl carrier protein [Dactylosporangium sp. NPDC048998]|uniref:acyl carrier protein n=1 Tax=Dactylosporangium sp. NPDC048998 TaxID=3363976 RepID=UPI003713F263
MTADIRAVLRDALADVLHKDIGELNDDTRLFAELGLDSTGVIELIMELEDAIDVRIDPETVTADVFETVASLVGYLEAHVVHQSAG